MKDMEGEDLALEIGLIKGPLVARVVINRNGCHRIESQVETDTVALLGV